MPQGNPYRRALASPGALRFSAAGFLGRLQISMFGLGIVLLISSLSGRYGLAGAGYALGSMIGGLWYGARAWRAPLRRRFAVTLCAVAAGTATFWAMPGLAALAAVMIISGLVLSPMLITGFSLIEQQAPAARLTEGMAWLTSALAVGTAVGSAAAGQVIDAGGARWGYAFAAACAAGAALACLAGLTWLGEPSPLPSPAAGAEVPP